MAASSQFSGGRILSLAGDGIGPEITEQACRVLGWLNDKAGRSYMIEDSLVGGASIDAYGTPLTDATLDLATKSDAVLLGAVGGPKWDDIPFDKKPERGLLSLRQELGLFANLRPAKTFKSLVGASTLKPEVVSGLDIMIVRELTGGIYFGQPRGIENVNGKRRGINTLVYNSDEVERIGRVAFDLAKSRQSNLYSIDKANVLEATILWREEISNLAQHYPGVKLQHMYVDNAAMQLVRDPSQFDVIVTTNMFGDILSDIAAMLTGSLGMLPSASLGATDGSSKRCGMYEPIHGSAPDIAGKGVANPLAMILSCAMMLRLSFGDNSAANAIERAVEGVLDAGMRTADIMEDGRTLASTKIIGDHIIHALEREGQSGGL